MKLNRLGRTDLMVTQICLGTMTWGVQNTENDAHEQLDYAVDAGVNFIDTAEGYAIPMSPESYGKTETYIGNWFKKSGKRDRVILASKIADEHSRAGDQLANLMLGFPAERAVKRVLRGFAVRCLFGHPVTPGSSVLPKLSGIGKGNAEGINKV